MKVLVLVSSVDQIPPKLKKQALVVTQLNWQEITHYLEGKTDDVYLFVHENCPYERLLKVIEEYKGNMAVYTTSLFDTVLMSRFTKVLNRRQITIDPKFGDPSDLEASFAKLKKRL